jgi:hypothetical protein
MFVGISAFVLIEILVAAGLLLLLLVPPVVFGRHCVALDAVENAPKRQFYSFNGPHAALLLGMMYISPKFM